MQSKLLALLSRGTALVSRGTALALVPAFVPAFVPALVLAGGLCRPALAQIDAPAATPAATPAAASATAPGPAPGPAPGDVDYDYSPFNPVPAAQMRALSTDQLGKAASPLTVDAGHFQIETRLLDSSFERDGPTTMRQWSSPGALLKLGLTDGVDFEVQAPSEQGFEYHDRRTGQLVKARGLSDSWVGAKLNIFGDDPNDGPAFQSLAIIPMIKIPTAQSALGHNAVEATIAIPYKIDLPGFWSLTLENADGVRLNSLAPGYVGHQQGYHGDYQGIVNISHPLYFSSLTASIEYAFDAATQPYLGHSSTLDPALQWQITRGLAFDVGDYIGLSGKVPGQHPYVGLTARF